MIRLISVLTLILAVLPWGAYANRMPSASEDRAVVVASAAGAVAEAERRCHGKSLRSGPCGMDTILPRAIDVRTPLSAATMQITQSRPGDLFAPDGLLEPPKAD